MFGGSPSTAKLDSYQAGSEVQVTSLSTLCDGVTAGSSIHFESTAKGYGCDNPTDPLVLPILTCEECANCVSNPGLSGNFPIDTSARVVELVLTSVSSVTLRASISGAQGLSGGRSIIFAYVFSTSSPARDDSCGSVHHLTPRFTSRLLSNERTGASR